MTHRIYSGILPAIFVILFATIVLSGKSQSITHLSFTGRIDTLMHGKNRNNPINVDGIKAGEFRTFPQYSIPNVSINREKTDASNLLLNEAGSCNTYTFRARLQPPAGDSLALIDLSPMLTREIIVAANQLRASNTSILLIKLMQDGAIAQQLLFRIEGRSVIGTNMQVRQQKEILLAGYFSDNARQIFLCSFSLDFQVKWIKVYDIDGSVKSLKSDLRSENGFTVGVQTETFNRILKLGEDGNVQWSTTMERLPGTDLKAVNLITTGEVLISQTDISGGLPKHGITALNGSNGSLLDARIADHGIDSAFLTDFGGFDNRFASAGILKKPDGSQRIFILHTQQRDQSFFNYFYTLPSSFSNSGKVLIAPALDATAAFDPQNGLLYLINQYYFDNNRPRRQRQFTIDGKHQLNCFAKTVDAGFIFGFTNEDGKLLLLKSDSAGNLPGCTNSPLNLGFDWVTNIKNPLTKPAQQSSNATYPIIATISSVPGSSTMSFDCREKYCPTVPLEDSCTPSFFKILRTSYFGSGVYSGFIQNEKIYTYGNVYEDISRPEYSVTGMLGLYDLKGNHIKSVRTYIDGQRASTVLWPYRNGQSMAAFNLGKFGERQHWLICLFDSNLKPQWSLPIESYFTWSSYSFAPVVTDIEYDDNGDIYVVLAQSNHTVGDNNISVIKIDEAGVFKWSKTYQVNSRSSGATNATVTPESLVILSEAITPGAFTLAVSKTDGSLLAKNSLANNPTNGVSIESNRLVKYHKGKIYYVGTYDGGTTGTSGLAAATLNTLGKPEKFYYYLSTVNSRFDASLFNDRIDIAAASNLMSGFKTVKAQLNLQLEVNHAFAYDTEYYLAEKALMHDSLGNPYELGFLTATNEYTESAHYLTKFNLDGSIGSCSKTAIPFERKEVNLVDYPLQVEASTKTYKPGGSFQLQTVDDENGLQVAILKCLSQTQCKELSLDGPTNFCDAGKEHAIQVKRSAGCSLPLSLEYDTAVIKEVKIRENEIGFKTNRPGATWLKATLNTGCDLYQDSIHITVPVQGGTLLNLGIDRPLCPKDSLKLSAGSAFLNYRWSTGSEDSTLIVKNPGTYWMHVVVNSGILLQFRKP
jgi:hypothetical protein